MTTRVPHGVRLTLGILLALFALGFDSSAFGQEEVCVTGYVRDALTGKPIASANVEVVGYSIGTATDEQGRFEIRGLLWGEYNLRVSHVAYEPARVEHIRVGPGAPERLVIQLLPRVISFPPIVASADREGKLESGRTVLDRVAIERSGAATLGELLALVPAVEVNRTGTGSTVSIRGSKSDQVLVLLDGIPLNDPVTGSVQLEELPLSLVESVEIVKSGSSALYGSGAVGGVLIIHSRRTYLSSAEMLVRAGSYGLRQGSPAVAFALRGSTGSAALDLYRWSGDYPYTYRIGEEERKDIRRNSDLRRRSLLVRWELPAGRWTYRARLMDVSTERGIPGNIYALSPYARGQTRRTLVSLAVQPPSSLGHGDFTLSYSHYRSRYVNSVPADAPLRDRSVPPYDSELRHDFLRVAGKTRTVLRYGTVGIDGGMQLTRVSDADQLALDSASRDVRSYLLSIGCVYRLSQRLPFAGLEGATTLAIRQIHASIGSGGARRVSYSSLVPTIFAEIGRSGNARASLYVRYAGGFRMPTYGDLFYQDYRVRGNPNLLPERSTELSAGFQFADDLGPLHATVHAEAFHRKVLGFIAWRLGAFATFSPVNVDAAMDGHEADLVLTAFGGQVRLQLSGERLFTRNLSADPTTRGKSLPFRPEYQVHASLEFRLGRLRAVLAHQWVGARWVTEANTVRLPGYRLINSLADVHVGYFFGLGMKVVLQVLNAGDSRYQILESAPLPGRELRIGLQLTERRESAFGRLKTTEE